MKARYLLPALLLGAFGIGSIAPTAQAASVGKTSLEILPLDEEFPRFIHIGNLEFATRYNDEHNTDHSQSNELTITFLDSRKDKTNWELQLKVSDFTCAKNGSLAGAVYTIGVGNFAGKNESAIKGLEAFEYSTEDASNDFQTLIKSTGEVDRGEVTYTVPVQETTLRFPEGTKAGRYYAPHSWRIVNADL